MTWFYSNPRIRSRLSLVCQALLQPSAWVPAPCCALKGCSRRGALGWRLPDAAACPGLLRQGEWNPVRGPVPRLRLCVQAPTADEMGPFQAHRGACVSVRYDSTVCKVCSHRPRGGPGALAISLVFRDGDSPALRRLVMLHAGAGTLVTPAPGSVVSRWGSAPQHVVQPTLVTETKAGSSLLFAK